MSKRFGKSLDDLISHNIMVVDFIGKSSSFDGMIPSEVVVGS